MSDSDSESENKEEKIKIIYNGKEKIIDTPEGYKELLEAFLKEFKTDKDKEYIFFYLDNEKEKIIQKDLTFSDFNNIDKVYVKEPKKENENETVEEFIEEVQNNQLSDQSDDESQEKDEEKIKIIYNGLEKIIDTPEDYKGLFEAFLKAFNTDKDKDKEYIFFYMDNGKENIIQKDLTSSDFNNIDKVFVKGPKKENEDEGETIEEIEVEKKPLKDPDLSYMSNDNLLQKSSSETEKKLSSKQDINTETTLINNKELNEAQNNSDKKSEDIKNEETISIVKENSEDKKDDNKENSEKISLDKKQLMSTISPASISKKSLDKISLDKISEDKKSVEEEDEYMKINPNDINDINELSKKMKEVQDVIKKLYKQKRDNLNNLQKELKNKEKKIESKEDEINQCKSNVGKNYESKISELENKKMQIKSIISSIEGNKSKEAKEQTKKNNEKQKEIENLNTKKSEQKDVNVKLKSEIEELTTKKNDLNNQLKEWNKKLEDKIRKEKGGNSRDIYDLILPINNSNLEDEQKKALKKREERDEKKKGIQLKLSNQFQKKFKKYQKEKTSFNKSDIIDRENAQKKKIFENFRSKYGKENMDNNIEDNENGKIDELIKENKDLKNKIKSFKKKKQKKREVKPEQDSDNKKGDSKKSSKKKIRERINNSEAEEKEEDEKERKEKEEKERKEKEEKERKEKEEKERKEKEEKERKEKEEKERKEKEEKERKEKEEKERKEKEEKENEPSRNDFSIFNDSVYEDAPNPKGINQQNNVNHVESCASPIEYYSYKCANEISLSSYIYEKTESTSIKVEIENNGSQVWPENSARLKFDPKSQIKGDDLILKPQKPSEKILYEIQFNNLSEYKEGTYESYVYFYINEENYGERLVLRIKISKKDISEVEQNLDKIKEFRELFDLSESDYSNEVLYKHLKNSDFDMEYAFSILFET